MKVLFAFALVFLAVISGCSAESSLASIDAQLPSCSLDCFAQAIEDAPCSDTNLTCLCLNISAEFPSCIESSCSVKEVLAATNVTAATCGLPVRNDSAGYVILSISLCCLVALVVAVRLLSKFVIGTTFGLDDLFTVFTALMRLPSTVFSIQGLVLNGLGRDMWTLAFQQITDFTEIFYILEILYICEISLLKLSILFFFLRIFPQPRTRRIIWVTIFVVILYGLLFLFLAAFQCQPIDYFWTRWDGEHQGRCVNMSGREWSGGLGSVVLDVWMIGLVVSEIRHLNMHWKRKIAVGLMLSVGAFVTIVSMLRLQSLVNLSSSANPTWDAVSVLRWFTVEMSVGIICICMPSIRALLKWLAPKVMGTTMQLTQLYASNTQMRSFGCHQAPKSSPPPTQSGSKIEILLSKSYTVESERNSKYEDMLPAHVGYLSVVSAARTDEKSAV